MKNKKGQMTAIGLVMVFVAIVLLASLFPTITEFINIAKACASSTTDVVLDLVPLMLVIAVIMGIVIYATGGQPQAYIRR